MDKIDLQIINELVDDARKPFREIAKKIGVSTQTVIKRYNEMKQKGTIQICAISIDANKIGYEGVAYLLITGSPGTNLSDAMNRLKKTENIIIATKAIGDYEGYAVLVFKNAKDLYEKVHQIKLMPEMENIEVSFTTPVPFSIPPTGRPVLTVK
jgi:Lrp/AsnC family transcriptional regulator for asnA, asnC and gidA